MTYKESLDYLYSQLPMYQRQGKQAFKKDLKNIRSLCKHFGDPQDSFPSIHIAGTNGKGTVAHILSAIFQQAGLKVGLYTSPHYKDFRERIKINGEFIPKRNVSRFTEKVIYQIESIRPSFFEITVAMAFDHFRNEQVDLAIIETGLGGRLDSTNVITPVLSIITNISLDHQSMLGNTISKIAKEKAGIIKKGVPLLIGQRQKETTKVFINKASKQRSTIYFGEDLASVHNGKRNKDLVSNPYNSLNERTAKAAIAIWNTEKLGKWISKKVVSNAIQDFRVISKYIGRWQVLGKDPLVIADSAHNEGGVSLLVDQLLRSYDPGSLHFVLGFVKDKPLDKVLSLFPKESSYYFCQAKIPRALSTKNLQEMASGFGLKGNTFVSVKRALRFAKTHASRGDAIIVCGSIFIVSEIT